MPIPITMMNIVKSERALSRFMPCPTLFFLTLKVLVTTIDALGHFHSTVRGDGGSRVGEV